MSQILVVYHVKTPNTICFDGFLSATLMWQKFGDSATYLPVMYSQELPDDTFVGKDVYFVDFSYDVSKMDRIASVANSLRVFDHHMPKAGSFADRSYAVFSNTDSGCTLVWKHLHGVTPMPLMLTMVDAGDRVLNSHPDVPAFLAALSAEEPTFENWSRLINTLHFGSAAYSDFIEAGLGILKYEKVRIDSLVRDSFDFELCGIKGLAVNTNKFFGHLTAMRLASYSKTFGAAFYLRPDHRVEVSLRRIDPDIDVDKIAKTFGGGGHAGAAAFSVSIPEFQELLTKGSETPNRLYVRLEAAIKNFSQVLDSVDYINTAETSHRFFEHLCQELGAPMAEDIEFKITESVDHPKFTTRLGAALASLLFMPKVVERPRWYHRWFPYVERKKISFDEDSIRGVLLESRNMDNPQDIKAFLTDRLLETVNVSNTMELVQSIYYIHISVTLPGSRLVLRQTFEVFK